MRHRRFQPSLEGLIARIAPSDVSGLVAAVSPSSPAPNTQVNPSIGDPGSSGDAPVYCGGSNSPGDGSSPNATPTNSTTSNVATDS